jgi:hypothetical protein
MRVEEWQKCTDPSPMLKHLRARKRSERKLRLFACACLRRVAHLIEEKAGLRALEVAERFADGQASDQQRAAAEKARIARLERDPGLSAPVLPSRVAILVPLRWQLAPRAIEAAQHVACDAARAATFAAAEAAHGVSYGDPWTRNFYLQETEQQAELIREIFFKPLLRQRPKIEPAWRMADDGATVKLAEAIYAERAFDRMPILADALEDAGCTHADVLGHCRGPGTHVRGCWVLDLLLGKE